MDKISLSRLFKGIGEKATHVIFDFIVIDTETSRNYLRMSRF
jgi:hypothetical protein